METAVLSHTVMICVGLCLSTGQGAGFSMMFMWLEKSVGVHRIECVGSPKQNFHQLNVVKVLFCYEKHRAMLHVAGMVFIHIPVMKMCIGSETLLTQITAFFVQQVDIRKKEC